MIPKEFVKAFRKDAEECQKTTGIDFIATLTQAALETGWAKAVPGNMFFGIKAGKNEEKKQLVTTTEYTSTAKNPMPVAISSTLVTRNGKKMYKHIGKDWFRKYDTPADSFKDHSKFFFENPRYKKALEVRGNHDRFFEEIAKAGYATDPNYADTLKAVAKTIKRNL